MSSSLVSWWPLYHSSPLPLASRNLSSSCLITLLPAIRGNTGLSNHDYVECYSAFRQRLQHQGLYNFDMQIDEIFASLEHDRIAVTTLGTAQYASGAYEMIPCLFVLHYNADSTRITRINEYVGAFLKPFIEAILPYPVGRRC